MDDMDTAWESALAEIAAAPEVRVNWFEARPPRDHEVGIVEQDGGYLVYTSNERGGLDGPLSFPADERDAALDRFRARVHLRALELRARGPGR